MGGTYIELHIYLQKGTTEPKYLRDKLGMYRKLVSSRSFDDYGQDSFSFYMQEADIQPGVNTGPDLPEVNPDSELTTDPFAVIDRFSAASTLPKVYVYLDGFKDAFAARDAAILDTPRTMDIMVYDTATPGRYKVGYLANQIRTASEMANFKRLFPDQVAELCLVHQDPALFTECMGLVYSTPGGGLVVATNTFLTIAIGVTLLAVTLALLAIWLYK
jgi:hypothetical protein